VGVAIVVVVAIVAALALADDEDSPSLADPEGPAASAPSRPTVPTVPGQTTTLAPDDLEAAIDEAIAFIEAERERSFTTRPMVEALDDSAFVDRFSALIDEEVAKDPQGIEAANVIYRAFGLIDPDQDIVEVERSFGAAGVLGFYDPERDELVVRGGDVTPFFRTVLVHELTHALDDQLIELNRPEYDDADDEVGFGLSAVAEGNARRIERAFYDTLPSDEQDDADREEASYGANFDLGDFKLSYLLLQLAPYQYGEDFVNELVDSGGEDAVDDALRDPPHTSEQVIDFEKFEAREPRLEVAPPPADGDVIEDGVVGQVAIAAILADADPNGADRAADGWAGDWFVAWKAGTASCVRAVFVMETSSDRDQLLDALDNWAQDHRGEASVSEDGDEIELTSCAG
jgi:hypothetical protein